MRIKTLYVWVVASMMLHGAFVIAQERSDKEKEARRLYTEGMASAQKGDCKAAVDMFEQSMAALPNKGSLYNLAICYNKLEQYQQAMSALLQLVREFDTELRDDMKASAKAEMKALKERFTWVTIATEHEGAEVLVEGISQGKTPLDVAIPLEKKVQTIVIALQGYKPWIKKTDFALVKEETFEVALEPEDGQLMVTVPVDGATVMVDDKRVGITPIPAPLVLAPGEHRIQVIHNSFEPIDRIATITSGALTTSVIDKGAMVKKESVDNGNDGHPDRDTPVVATKPPSKRPLFRWGGFAAVGVGAAAIIGGTITGSMALGIDKDLSKKCPNGECPEDVDYESDEQKMNNLGASSTALLISGGVIAAAGATLAVLSYKLDFGESEQVGFVPAISPELLGASLSYSF